uniref:Uncharacterized protein n=1 Tax=Meloidogyne enterolobii TaxID=390850 RepID=A0A6V7V499_MELEN|nr:unnamed protein product [Meloidogyne enterolobii]
MKYFIAIVLLHLVFFKNADCDCSISCPKGQTQLCQFSVDYNYGPQTQTSSSFTTSTFDKKGKCQCKPNYVGGNINGILVCDK